MMRGLSDIELNNIIGQMISDKSAAPGKALPAEYGVIEVAEPISHDRFRAYKTASASDMVAVDGGSANVLDGGSFVIAGVRVGRAVYRNRTYAPSGEPEMHLLHLSSGDIGGAYSIFFSKIVGTGAPDAPRGLDEAVGRIRALLEWNQVENVLKGEIAPGTVLSFDGALWAGIRGIDVLISRIVSLARDRGVILCGISKRSMLTHESRPLIPAIQMASKTKMPDAAWLYPVQVTDSNAKLFGDVHVAMLHPRSQYAFRVDLSLPNGVTAEDAFGQLAYHSIDPGYVGYPYPLVRAHNDVAFSKSEIEDLRRMLRAEALRKGMDPAEWQMTFQDFHEVLDRGR
ncbi:MAG: DNA double-strand break repair nuclease NurA [Thermoplasmata archaeon]|nr:DNA double-strand break repair nuclease NurA [Thermoplasmata archaeon]